MPAQWPLTGRTEELRLIDVLPRRRGGAGGVVLAGPAGVGKTRLAHEVLAGAARRGVLTRWATATASARALPLGAFAPLTGSAGVDPTQLIPRAAQAVAAGAGPRGVLLGVDDGHLLDDLSALLVHQLVVRGEVTVVVTLRSGEPAPDAVTALWKDGHLQRLELQPLSGPETGMLLEAVLGGPVDSAAADRLWSITRGNPLYLRQLVEGEREAGRLCETAGVWRWSGRPQLSPGLVELIQERIGGLSDADREVVEVLAFGEPLGVSLLARLTGPDAVERAEARGLIEVSADGRRLEARLAHPLYGEAQRARCGPLRARRLRGRMARELTGTGARRHGDALRRAVLALDSDLQPDPALLADAAHRALGFADCGLAERLARAAVAAGGGFEPRLTLSIALSWMARGGEADAELAALAEAAATDAELCRAVAPRAANLFWTMARPAEAEAVPAVARATVGSGAAALDLVAIGSVFDGFLARTTEAAAAATSVVADERSSPDALIFAVWGLVTAGGGLGRLAGLAEAVRRVDTVPGSLYLGLVRIGAVGQLWIRALRLAGEMASAESTARAYRDRVAGGTDPLRSMITTLIGQVAIDRGLPATAARQLREAASGFLIGGFDQHVLVSLTTAQAMLGDGAAARSTLADASAARHQGNVFLEPEAALARAWVAAAEGSVSEAITQSRWAADIAAAQSQPAVEVVALHTAVCFGDRTVAGRLAELATRVDGPRAPTAAAHAAALAADDGAALTAASVRLEEMGALLLAADAAAQASTSHDRQGHRGPARAAAARARLLRRVCEGAATPALRALAVPLPLTDREREVVTLAAGGLSNREIADRLALSTRTVEGHLYRACAKLGTSHRTELGALLDGG